MPIDVDSIFESVYGSSRPETPFSHLRDLDKKSYEREIERMSERGEIGALREEGVSGAASAFWRGLKRSYMSDQFDRDLGDWLILHPGVDPTEKIRERENYFATHPELREPESQSGFARLFGVAGNAMGSSVDPMLNAAAAGAAAGAITMTATASTGIGAPISPVVGAVTTVGVGLASFQSTFRASKGRSYRSWREAGLSHEDANGWRSNYEALIDAGIEMIGGGVVSRGTQLVSRMATGSAKEISKRTFENMVLNSLGKKVGKNVALNFLGRVGLEMGREGAGEALEEGLQYVNSYLWHSLGGDKTAKFSWQQLADNMADGFIGGFALGGPTGAVGAIHDSRVLSKQNKAFAQAVKEGRVTEDGRTILDGSYFGEMPNGSELYVEVDGKTYHVLKDDNGVVSSRREASDQDGKAFFDHANGLMTDNTQFAYEEDVQDDQGNKGKQYWGRTSTGFTFTTDDANAFEQFKRDRALNDSLKDKSAFGEYTDADGKTHYYGKDGFGVVRFDSQDKEAFEKWKNEDTGGAISADLETNHKFISKHFGVRKDGDGNVTREQVASLLNEKGIEATARDLVLCDPKSASAKVFGALGKLLGIDVQFFAPAQNGNAARYNGVAPMKGGGTLYLNVFDTVKRPFKTLGHEFKHYLDSVNKEASGALDATFDKYTDWDSENVKGEMADLANRYRGKSTAFLREEYRADRMGDCLSDPKFCKMFAEELRSRKGVSALEKFKADFRYFVARVKQALKTLGLADSQRGRELFKDYEACYREISKVLVDAKAKETQNVAPVQEDTTSATDGTTKAETAPNVENETHGEGVQNAPNQAEAQNEPNNEPNTPNTPNVKNEAKPEKKLESTLLYANTFANEAERQEFVRRDDAAKARQVALRDRYQEFSAEDRQLFIQHGYGKLVKDLSDANAALSDSIGDSLGMFCALGRKEAALDAMERRLDEGPGELLEAPNQKHSASVREDDNRVNAEFETAAAEQRRAEIDSEVFDEPADVEEELPYGLTREDIARLDERVNWLFDNSETDDGAVANWNPNHKQLIDDFNAITERYESGKLGLNEYAAAVKRLYKYRWYNVTYYDTDHKFVDDLMRKEEFELKDDSRKSLGERGKEDVEDSLRRTEEESGTALRDEQGNRFNINSAKDALYDSPMLEDLVKNDLISREDIDDFKNNVEKLIDAIAPHAFLMDIGAEYNRDNRPYYPYKPNSDPIYKISLDFSTLCKKRLFTQKIIENLQAKLNRVLSAEEQLKVRNLLKEYQEIDKGIQVACHLCYVEAARLKSPKQINRFFNDPKVYIRDYFAKRNEDFADYITKFQGDLKEKWGLPRDATKKEMKEKLGGKKVDQFNKLSAMERQKYKMSAEERAVAERAVKLTKNRSNFLSADKLTQMAMNDFDIYSAYTNFVRTSTHSKSMETDVPYYYGDSNIMSDKFIEKMNEQGTGLRHQSWSDFTVTHLLDSVVAVCDLAVRKAKMHAYTKVIAFPEIFGNTGIMINMSLIPNENGVGFSSVEGMDFEEAKRLREKFPDTCGTIAIAMNDEQLFRLLDDPNVDMVIPYHISGLNKKLREKVGIADWKDYTRYQESKLYDKDAPAPAGLEDVWHKEPDQSEYLVDGEDGQKAMTLSGRRYVELCRERGVKPKFEDIPGLLQHPNFWKVLVDHKMINQKTNTLIKQQALKPNFNFDAAQKLIAEEAENYDPTRDARAYKYVQEHLPRSFFKARHSIGERVNGFESDVNRHSISQKGVALFNVDGFGSLDIDSVVSNDNISPYNPVLTDSGNQNWGYITEEMISNANPTYGLEPLPIRLFKGDYGFGLVHLAKHFPQIQNRDISFLMENVFGKPNQIFCRIDGNAIKLEIFPKPMSYWGILELRKENDCYSIVSFYPRSNKFSKPKGEKIWEYSSQSIPSQAANDLSKRSAPGKMLQDTHEELTAKSPNNISPETEKSSEIEKKVEENATYGTYETNDAAGQSVQNGRNGKNGRNAGEVEQLSESLSGAVQQKFGSAGTSLRQVASGFKKIDFVPGTVNLDLGGGKFDEATKYLDGLGVRNLIFDPFNRSAEHNRQIFDEIRNGGVDTVTCNNVLNVIAEEEARRNVILQSAKALKPDGTAYFTVYEGDGSGNAHQSKSDSWQNFRKTGSYIDEISEFFDDVTLKDKVIIAKNPKIEGKTAVWQMDETGKDTERFSLNQGAWRRGLHQQINPVVEIGDVQNQRQELLGKEYTPEQRKQWEQDATAWIQRQGGVQNAITNILADSVHRSPQVQQLVEDHIVNSEVFKKLPADRQIAFQEMCIQHRADWGRQGVAMKMNAMNMDSVSKVQAFFNRLDAQHSAGQRIANRNDILDATGIDIWNITVDDLQSKSKLQQVVEKLHPQVGEGQTVIDQSVIDNYIKQIQDANSVTANQQATIADQGNTINEQGAKINEQGATINEQAATISEQAAAIDGLENDKATAEQKAADLEREIENMESKMSPDQLWRHKERLRILRETGVDIDKVDESILNDRDKLDALLRERISGTSKLRDQLYEYWINAIMSGIGTHLSNVAGNTVNALYEFGPKRFTEALLNTVMRRKDGATLKEYGEMMRAIDFKKAWRKGVDAFNHEVLGNETNKMEWDKVAIPGKTGRIIRIPGRLLHAADEFCKAIYEPMSAAAYAYRIGKANGLKGGDMNSFVQLELATEDSASNNWGEKESLKLTFQEPPGSVVEALIRLRDQKTPVGTFLKYLMPFIKTPSNILRQGVRKSQLGIFNLAWETGEIALKKRRFDGEFVGHVAEQVLAWGTFFLLKSLMDDDDDEFPLITGTSPKFGSREQKFKQHVVPPYSIRIGDTYWSYRRIEPLATGLALMADLINEWNAAKNGKSGTAVMKRLLLETPVQLIADKSFIDSIGQIVRCAEDPEYEVPKFATNFISSWMPNIYRQTFGTNSIWRDTVPESKSRNSGVEWWKDQFWVTTNRMGLTTASPKIDYYGREVLKDDLDDAGALSLYRLTPTQMVTPDEHMTKGEYLMWRYNQRNPNSAYYPDIMPSGYTRDGKHYTFTAEEYQDVARKAGKLALKQTNNAFMHGVLNAHKPTDRDIKVIKEIFTRARKEVIDEFHMRHHKSHRDAINNNYFIDFSR